MSKPGINVEPKVKVNIRLGQVSPAQNTAWKRFWKKLIDKVKASERT